MKRKRAALYDPYLDTLGGGEKHILSILKVLEDNGYNINIFWNKNLNKDILNRLNIPFKTSINYLPNIFQSRCSLLRKIYKLKEFDIFFYVTDGSYFFSTAQKNFVFCMIPQRDLYQMSIFNKLKTLSYRFIANSNFTKNWLYKWGIKAQVIYPYIENNFTDLSIRNIKKDKIILSVGRFFGHLHSKKQDIIISLFKKLQQKNPTFKEFQLILVGGLRKEDNHYFEKLENICRNDPSIILKPNLDYQKLRQLYKKSLLFWHLTGFGLDTDQYPEKGEHLGITPLEAIASGCITFCYNAGGPKEIINDGKNGFLFESVEELFKKTHSVVSNLDLQENIRKYAKQYIDKNFSYDVFKKRVEEVILHV